MLGKRKKDNSEAVGIMKFFKSTKRNTLSSKEPESSYVHYVMIERAFQDDIWFLKQRENREIVQNQMKILLFISSLNHLQENLKQILILQTICLLT